MEFLNLFPWNIKELLIKTKTAALAIFRSHLFAFSLMHYFLANEIVSLIMVMKVSIIKL